MAIFTADNQQLQVFTDDTQSLIQRLSDKADKNDLAELEKLVENFKRKQRTFIVKTES